MEANDERTLAPPELDSGPPGAAEGDDAPHYIIRRIRLAHCKRGPANCETCRAMKGERLCLLHLDPPDAGLMQRPSIQVELDGEPVWRVFDVLRTFADEQEAQAYALEHGIEDIQT